MFLHDPPGCGAGHPQFLPACRSATLRQGSSSKGQPERQHCSLYPAHSHVFHMSLLPLANAGAVAFFLSSFIMDSGTVSALGD